ncbi:glycoside hydrolase family 43 protein [Asticcacaulis tiandongensis]|uniref:glycoside hydrolase family 43 protein n=1 Tax=Asticcacaulis tiandongensis TaxID=2565365 RepID=UPI0011287BEA|nr:glycoside hydrolase family 43 protein [Asticcacaulis tiandongensis]
MASLLNRRDLMHGLTASGLMLSGLSAGSAAQAAGNGHFVFSYFKNKDRQAQGLHLAISADGRRYEAIGDGKPLLVPEVGQGKLMRDPCLLKDPQRELYHLVWTTGWTDITIGYASSPDLINWSEQRAIPVMQAFEGTRNTWAPEVIYDDKAGHFMIFWSSTITGAFPETAGQSEDNYNHRLYYTTTKDFLTFSDARLLYDPGFSVIDASFLRRKGKLYMFIKDERLKPEHKYLQWVEAKSPTGPFSPLSEPITESWVEGPTAINLGKEVLVFFDKYRTNQFGAVATRDFVTWRDVTADIVIPQGASHGTIIPVSRNRYKRLKTLVP